MSKEEKTKDAIEVDERRLFVCATLPKPCPEYDEIMKAFDGIELTEVNYDNEGSNLIIEQIKKVNND